MGDTRNCKKFYRCVNNGNGGFTRYEFVCGPNTVWDPDAITCNYPHASKREECRNYVEQPQNTSSTNCPDGTNTTPGSTTESTTSGTESPTTDISGSTGGTTNTEQSTPSNTGTDNTTPASTIGESSTTNTIPESTPGSTITDGTTPGSTVTDGTTGGTDSTSQSTVTDNTTPGTGTATDNTTPGTGTATDNTTPGTGTVTDNTTPGTGTAPGEGTTSGGGTESTTAGTDGSTGTDISTTTLGTTGGESTTDSSQSTTAPCPIGQLEGDQIALVCPTGFRRHPKYCNLFYQCTKNPDNHDFKILVLSCPEGTIYDDEKIQCLPQNETTMCNGQIAQSSFYKTLTDNSLPPVSFTPNFNYHDYFNLVSRFQSTLEKLFAPTSAFTRLMEPFARQRSLNVNVTMASVVEWKLICTNAHKGSFIGR